MNKYIFKIVVMISMLHSSISSADSNDCGVEHIQKERNGFLIKYKEKKYVEAAKELEEELSSCYGVWNKNDRDRKSLIKAYFWALSDYLLALEKSGNINKCLSAGKSELEAYPKIYDDDNAPEILATRNNIESCKLKWEEQFREFSSNNCKISEYSSNNNPDGKAIAAPLSWNIARNSSVCVAIHEPQINSAQLDGHEGGRFHLMDRPYLILVEKNGENIEERFFNFSGGALGSNEKSADGSISVGGDSKRRLVRFKGYTPYLWPGTASMATDAVYELTNDGTAKLVDEVGFGFH